MAGDRMAGGNGTQILIHLKSFTNKHEIRFLMPFSFLIDINSIDIHASSVKESVNVKMTTAIIHASRFTFISLQKRQRKSNCGRSSHPK